MSERTQEQERAANALARIEHVKTLDPKLQGLYRSYVESLPAHIVMGGLGQAIATELAAARLVEDKHTDGKKAHAQLADDLTNWLGSKIYNYSKKSPTRLITAITENDQQLYLRAQAEALAWLVWLKKFCQAQLPKNSGGDE